MPIYQDALKIRTKLDEEQKNGVQDPSSADTLRALSILAMIQSPAVAQKIGTESKQALIIRSQKNSQTVAFTNAGAMAHCLPWFLGYLARQQNNPEAQALRELIVASAPPAEELESKDQGLSVAVLEQAQAAYNSAVSSQASQQDDQQAQNSSAQENKNPGQQVTAAFSSAQDQEGVFARPAANIGEQKVQRQNQEGVFAWAAANIREQKVQRIEPQSIELKETDHYIQTIVAEALIHDEENVVHDQHGLISQTQYSQIVCKEERDSVTPFEAVVLCHAAGIFKGQSQRPSFQFLFEADKNNLNGLADNTKKLEFKGNKWELAKAPDKDNKDAQEKRIEFLRSKAVNVVAAYKELVKLHKENHAARAGGKRLVYFGVGSGLSGAGAAAAAAFFLAASGPALPIALGALAFVALAVGLLLRIYRRGRYSDFEVERNQIESAMNDLYGRSAGPAQAKMTRFHQGMIRDEGQRRYAGDAEFDGDEDKLGEAIVSDPTLYIHRGRNYRAGSDQTQVAKAQASAVVAYIKSDRCDWGKLAGFLSSDKFTKSQRTGCGWLGRATREGKIQAALQAEIENIKNDSVDLTSEQASSFLRAVFGENGAAFHLVDKDVVASAVEKAFQAGGGAELTEPEIKASGWYQGAGDFFSEAGYGAQGEVLSAFFSMCDKSDRQPQ